ncbi:acyl-CoA dehydrogenase family protein [Amycolatopsis sp. DG1A-15b]|uniref:acyl-CoA dehydrogenase family protein n=1 Tax=Amycolatopsis sp. DG1A-15b TaxID=3052846 RepID=UPI00255BEA9B|nr:acyl-CoA dehydrogenase family protein [Amycolatopsis sp. DG1A-15b]WIX90159.1 acyl-CoA dehydrogenase family protein [Amycolatopsis sp. DG1A-15b]
MRFLLSPEQRQFAATLHELLGGADTAAAARAWAAGEHARGLKLWRGLADVGVFALLVPQDHGGLGAGPADLVVAFEALGYHAVPGPLAESAAVAPALLTGHRLTSLAEGDLVATVVAPPEVPLALDADIAGLVLDLTGAHLTGADAGPVRSIDPPRRLFRVPAAAGRSGGTAFDRGVLAVAAQLLGAGQWLLDTSVAYAKQRRQYGRAIGEYQAIKHLLADVVTRLELARPLLYGAAVAGETFARDVSAAKVMAGDAALLAARTALQVHGAIGYTAEHDLGLRLTKVRALAGAWGTGSFHRARVLR